MHSIHIGAWPGLILVLDIRYRLLLGMGDGIVVMDNSGMKCAS